jgi:hypothetical protein
MKMNPSRATLSILLLILGGLILLNYLQRPQPSVAEAVRFISVLQKFSQDRVQRGQMPPASVQLDELVGAGYITAKDARHFVGSAISFSAGASEANPRTILIRLWLRDDRQFVLLGDGSIRQLQ